MTRFGKIALGAALAGGLAAGAALPANAARVAVGIGFGAPGYYGYYGGYYGHSCRWYFNRGLAAPAGCYGGYYGYGYGPVVYGYYGPRWHRVWVGGRWHWRRW